MCRSKSDGGHRCVSHSPANRRVGRVAFRLYGTDTAATREAVSRLSAEYVNASVAERRQIGLAAIDRVVMELAADKTNPGPEQRDTNPSLRARQS